MNKQTIPYSQTTFFSSLINDYLANEEKLHPFINHNCSLQAFADVIAERKQTTINRELLNKQLYHQYKDLSLSDAVKTNIEQLKNNNCFTVTTGHQLNLFTGPLYFLYKIISAINLAKTLKATYPENDFVPVYWMATEDHDFEEINHFNLFNERLFIQKEAGEDGAVGRLSLTNAPHVAQQLEELLGDRNGGDKIVELFKQFYTSNNNFTQATKALVNHLFGEYGLVIIDGDDAELKKSMIPYFEQELVAQKNHQFIEETTQRLTDLGYKSQVTPREINLFYLDNNLRERIVEEEEQYKVLNTNLSFTKEQILAELNNHPEKFSPNVVMRPLYQEVILPNLAYIGGGGELAYWFQLKDMFNANNVFFPTLILRNSVLIIDAGSTKKMQKLGLEVPQLFEDTEEIIKEYVTQHADINLALSQQKEQLAKLYETIESKAVQLDKTLQAVVNAELQKATNGINNIEARLLKAEKQREEVAVNQIRSIKDKLFPNGGLQERHDNMSSLLLFYGMDIIPTLMQHLHPLNKELVVLTAP
ncbi:MAG: bacillithiol biosynthesis cysteine-adding enzyme BshC [Vicingaceae bacterium]|nr:bacillithiol biosynthesis cysteine-adding enzyme BshC [Vicingaceae bacterium]